MKKYFVISDVHGEFYDMIDALNDNGFDENNDNHILVTLGDMFDRGGDSLAMYEYLKNLTDKDRAICLRGNHDTMLIDYLTGKEDSSFNYRLNGTRETLADFLHQTAPFETYVIGLENRSHLTEGDFKDWIKIARKEINEEYPDLLPWLESLPWYYETKNHIFTHASIDTSVPDWHEPHKMLYDKFGWDALTWDDGSFLDKGTNYIDKTIVVGHFHTRTLRKMYNIEDGKDVDSILDIQNNGHKIFIDGCTNASHKVNVLVVGDEELQ